MRKQLVLVTALLNSALFIALLTELVLYRAVSVWIFVPLFLLTPALFLLLDRHRRRNDDLDEGQKNRWQIALFLAWPISHPMYVYRYL